MAGGAGSRFSGAIDQRGLETRSVIGHPAQSTGRAADRRSPARKPGLRDKRSARYRKTATCSVTSASPCFTAGTLPIGLMAR